MLASAARQSGLMPLVIDHYADQDTCMLAEAVFKVDQLNQYNLETGLEYFISRYPVPRAIYGSGLEQAPECIDILARRFELLGNDYTTFRRVQNKRHFFALLAELKIPYPEVVFDRPPTCEGWLIKPQQGGGGAGIRRFTGQSDIEAAVYWQKMIPGVSGSALFLANRKRARIIGYNTQWNVCSGPDSEFVFAGIINKSPLSPSEELYVFEWIQALVRVYALIGLNTLDFIVQDGQVFALELNPRPSASMQLYSDGILSQHIETCRGQLDMPSHRVTGCCGYQLVFADKTLQIPENIEWPKQCMDLPATGVIIRKGQPICSMMAREKRPEQVFKKLKATQQILVNQLKIGHG